MLVPLKARRFAHNLFFSLAMLLFTLCVIELMARVTHHLLFGEGATSSLWRPPQPTAFPTRLSEEVLHPSYGFVRGWRSAPLNLMVFEERRQDILLVALMGGSVAVDVAGELRNALFRHFLESGVGPAPVLMDWSAGGHHQPQQAAILANMIANGAQLDVVVTLDGYNEVTGPMAQAAGDFNPGFPDDWVPRSSEQKGFHSSFPSHWPSLMTMSPEQMEIVRQLLELRDEERILRQLDTESVLRRSAVFRVIWRFRLARVERRLALGHHELKAVATVKYRLEVHGPRERYTGKFLRTVGPRLWYEGSRLIADLAERHDAEYFHFIQPNRHVPNSKPLSADELAMFDENDASSQSVPEGYRQMREYGHLLAEHGVHFFDLSWIFQDRPETLYRDSCCHLNKRGNELLADAMLRRIVDRTSHWASPSSQGDGPPTPLVRSVFDVFHLGTALGYAKTPCSLADTQATFFLHITPVREDDLPSSRSKHGFDNLDFSFARAGTVFDDRCVATVVLPSYPVAKVRTGQGGGAVPWDVEFSL